MISSVMAHLKTKETRNDAQARKEWKFRLTRRLYEQGYERQHILNLFCFLDWTLELPEALKQAFQAEPKLLVLHSRSTPNFENLECLKFGRVYLTVDNIAAIGMQDLPTHVARITRC